MSDIVIILEIFLRAGSVFAAVILTGWWIVARRPITLGLIAPAVWLGAFYAVCMTMIGVVALVHSGAAAGGASALALTPFLAVVILFLTVRRHARWLLAPVALLINASLAIKGMRTDVDQLIARLWSVKPYIFLLMGFLYLLVLILLYLLGRRVRLLLKETDPA
jgi:hypothetical protein